MGVLAILRRGEHAPIGFHFEVFSEWIVYVLDDTLRRQWEALTNQTGIPPTYSQLDAG
ncbi:hypothetical protein [Halopiger xanaduensis]|uniref:hypothetical protein n=1 Tax=Halopiger xanaduensis TaxID=387343 RepID=UPI00149443CA|nr:hypothetical protein [Halopiger xanaduensis]